jgi:hypothetical protein
VHTLCGIALLSQRAVCPPWLSPDWSVTPLPASLTHTDWYGTSDGMSSRRVWNSAMRFATSRRSKSSPANVQRAGGGGSSWLWSEERESVCVWGGGYV